MRLHWIFDTFSLHRLNLQYALCEGTFSTNIRRRINRDGVSQQRTYDIQIIAPQIDSTHTHSLVKQTKIDDMIVMRVGVNRGGPAQRYKVHNIFFHDSTWTTSEWFDTNIAIIIIVKRERTENSVWNGFHRLCISNRNWRRNCSPSGIQSLRIRGIMLLLA